MRTHGTQGVPSGIGRRSRGRAAGGGTRRSRWLVLAVGGAACLALIGGACSDDGNTIASKESESVSRDDSGAEATEPDGSEAGVPDSDSTSGDTPAANEDAGADGPGSDADEFGETPPGDGTGSGDFVTDVEAARAAIESATTSCELFDTLSSASDFGDPRGRAETEAAMNFIVDLMNKMAEVTTNADLSKRLGSAATNMDEYARSVDYDPALLDLTGDGPGYPGAEQDEAAMDEFLNDEIEECLAAEFGASAS